MEDLLFFLRVFLADKVYNGRFEGKYISSCYFERGKCLSDCLQQFLFVIGRKAAAFDQQGYFEMDPRVFDKGWTFKCISSLFLSGLDEMAIE